MTATLGAADDNSVDAAGVAVLSKLDGSKKKNLIGPLQLRASPLQIFSMGSSPDEYVK